MAHGIRLARMGRQANLPRSLFLMPEYGNFILT
jgi:hypothetical protein